MLPLLAIGVLAAASAEELWHWGRVPLPDGGYDATWSQRDEAVVALGQGCSLLRWDGTSWSPLSDGFGCDDAGVGWRLTAGADGSFWAWRQSGSIAHRWADGWGSAETTGVGGMMRLEVDEQGLVWTSHLFETPWLRDGDGWHRVPGLAVNQTDDTASYRLLGPDHQGGAWYRRGTRGLVHIGTDDIEYVELPSDEPAIDQACPATVDDQGLPVLANPAILRLTEHGWESSLDSPSTTVAARGAAVWALEEGRLISNLAGRESLPWPGGGLVQVGSPPCLWIRADGWPVVKDEARSLWTMVPGAAPTFGGADERWGLGSVADGGPVAVGDVDGDGRDDLVVVQSSALHLLLQRPDRFEDVTSAWGLELSSDRFTNLQLCDLDGDGRRDLLVSHEEPGQRRWIRYLRAHDGWFQDVGPVFASPDVGPDPGSGLLCSDLDGDGDLDLLAAGIHRKSSRTTRIALAENLGWGRLRETPLASRGLGHAQAWSSEILHEDFDLDGIRDFFVLNTWGSGHKLYRGLPALRIEDVTSGSGLDVVYAVEGSSVWTARLGGDDLPDLVVLDGHVQLYRNLGGLRFQDVTGGWRLPFPLQGATIVEDLDGDGRSDLLVCGEPRCRLFIGSPEGPLVERSEVLPFDTRGVGSLAALDLGTDGDRDVLLIRSGHDLLLENLGDRLHGARPRVPPDHPFGLLRRLAWARAWPDAVLAGLPLLAWLVGWSWCRRRQARLFVGRAAGAALAAGGSASLFVLFLESPPGVRGWLSAGLVLAAAITAAGEAWLDAWRKATRVAGYRLLRKLGTGGMGTVWHAREPGTGRSVALKIVHPEVLARDADRRLFHHEARVGGTIEDPRLVRILASGEWAVFEDGQERPTAYLVMELLTGTSLRELLRARGRLPPAEACALVREVALALEALHQHGIVHRDVKPDNVMLLAQGGVKLMDFGAAQRVGLQTRRVHEVLGTMGYFAPEQGRSAAPDPRADVYACGVVLHELLAGRRPFRSSDLVSLMRQILVEDPPSLRAVLPNLDAELDALVQRAMARDPEVRIRTAAELAEALGRWAGNLPLPEASPSESDRKAAVPEVAPEVSPPAPETWSTADGTPARPASTLPVARPVAADTCAFDDDVDGDPA